MTHTTSCMGFMFLFCAHISFLVASLSVLFVNPLKLPHNCTMDTETFKQKRGKYWPNWDIHVIILFPFFQYKAFRDFLCFLIALTRSIFELEKCTFFLNRSEFRYASKNSYSAGKTSGVLRGDASGANRGYVLAHCAPPPSRKIINFFPKIFYWL